MNLTFEIMFKKRRNIGFKSGLPRVFFFFIFVNSFSFVLYCVTKRNIAIFYDKVSLNHLF